MASIEGEGLQEPSAPSFEDVAAQLSYEGLAALVKHTGSYGFKAARQANHHLHDIYGRHVPSLDLTISPNRVQLWQQGRLSLARFPSLKAVSLELRFDAVIEDPAAMLLAPFSSGQPDQEPPVWPDITSFVSFCDGDFPDHAALGLYRAVPQLVRQLPNLRELDLRGFPDFYRLGAAAVPEVSRNLYEALGSLKSLEVLRVEFVSDVRHLQFLRRLEELELYSLECTPTPADVAGLRDLQHLKRLHIGVLSDDGDEATPEEGGLMHMINSLPALEEVRFGRMDFQDFGIGVAWAYNCCFRRRLQPLAVPAGRQPQGARRSRLLHQLTTCFGSYGVGSLCIHSDLDEDGIALVGRLLAGLDKLDVGCYLREHFWLRLQIGITVSPVASEPAPAAEALPAPEPLSVSAAAVAEAALRHMQCGDLDEVDWRGDGPVYGLLLQGSYLEGLRESPGALLPAIRSLGEKAAAAAANGGGGVPGPLKAYQELPAAARSSSLLLRCRRDQPVAVAAVTAAVQGVAAGRGPGFLRVAPVPGWPDKAFLRAVRKEIKVLWGDEANRRCVGDMPWLRHLLGLWRQLVVLLPPEQPLDW